MKRFDITTLWDDFAFMGMAEFADDELKDFFEQELKRFQESDSSLTHYEIVKEYDKTKENTWDNPNRIFVEYK